ncbi:MAG: hypothetical protein JW952_00880 [Candidatus Eisenbacteria bacterium]|nr:hypothetical protein [Candidatus Eisenbacteria bacterium]
MSLFTRTDCAVSGPCSGATAVPPAARRAPSTVFPALALVLTGLLVELSLCAPCAARSYNSPVADGVLHFTPADWDSDEVAVSDSPSDSKWTGNEIDSVLVTWDRDSLYVGCIYSVSNNAMMILIDAGTGVGDSDINNLDWYPRNFRFAEGAAEVIIAGWNAGTPGVRRITGDGTTQDLSSSCRIANVGAPGARTVAETAIPWDAVYGLGPGSVKPGAVLRVVALVAGGDNWGGGDSAPDNASVDGGGGPCTLTDFFLGFCDLDSDGVPDEGFPPSGAISGTVTLSNPDDHTTAAAVTVYEAGTAVVAGRASAPAGGGAYRVRNLFDGSYDVVFGAPSYVGRTVSDVTVTGGQEVTGVDATLQYVSGKITGSLTFADGPGATALVVAYAEGTTTAAGSGPTTVPPAGGAFTISVLPDADYDLVVTARGYGEVSLPVTVAGGATADVGAIQMYSVRGTRFVFVTSAGDFSSDALGTVSLPSAGVYLYVPVYVEAWDSLGQLDVDNVGGFRDSVFVSSSLLDPRLVPVGDVTVADRDTVELAAGVLLASAFQDGRAKLLVADDVEEVVLLRASPAPSLGYGTAGNIRVGFLPRNPVSVELVVEPDTILAGGVERAKVTGQLKDASGSDSREPNVPVDMKLLSGEGTLSPASTLTDTNGRFEVEFYSDVAGLAVVSDSAAYAGQKLATNSASVTVLPGPGSSVELESQYAAVYPGLRFAVSAQVTDAYGNEVKEPGVSIELSSFPPGKLSELTTPVVTDGNGFASAYATAAESYGAVEISGASPYAVAPVIVSVEADLVAVDEPSPESDPLHHSDPGMDLTGLYARLEDDTLRIQVPFVSGWEATHLAVLIEANGDADGLLSDAFRFPAVFDHGLRPDYVFTDKFSANSDSDPGNDYADFRRWAGPGVDSFWDLVGRAWTTDASNVNKNAVPWTRHDGAGLVLSIPAAVLGLSSGDSLRAQVYCMDEPGGVKRTSLDSCPHDSTHNMVGNWWETATDSVRLHNYAAFVLAPLPEAPTINYVSFSPTPATPGLPVLLAANVATGGGGIGDVTADLSPVGGSAVQRLYDDGTNGDAAAGDGSYACTFTLSESVPGGVLSVMVTARDASNRSKATAAAQLEVLVEQVVLRSFEDAAGDDHGPNLYGQEGLYYRYPTNPVFYAGSFDVTKVEIGDEGDWLMFKVWIGDLTNPSDPNAADWNATYPSPATCTSAESVELDLQNIVIYIDSEKGGATAGMPNRYADVARWDAWEYALVSEGWWKGAVASNGTDDVNGWTRYKSDSDFWFCTNHVENTIDMHVRKTLLGNPEEGDVASWDIIVAMCSHDGNSSDENLGMVRWVNEGSPAEWQFGGGKNGESGRERDSNIIDVAVSAGLGKLPGVTQDTMLKYTTEAANARFNAGQVAVVLEATRFEDYAPPAIEPLPTDGGAVTKWFAMQGSPLVIGTAVTDDDEVTEASLRWRPLRGSYSSPVGMSRLLNDLWVADLDFASVTSETDPVDGQYYLELRMSAADRSGNSVESRLFTVELDSDRPARHVLPDVEAYAGASSGEVTLQGVPDAIPEGSSLVLYSSVFEDAGKVYDLVFSSPSGVDLSHAPAGMGPFTGVARTFGILEREPDSTAGSGTPLPEFAQPVTFNLHYPSYAVSGLDTRGLAVYRWEEQASRWVLLGGNATSKPGLVSVSTLTPGTFALFADRFEFDNDKTLSAVSISPNPFSPNGDGLYEETHVSFYLKKPASVLIEIYDLSGEMVRRFQKTYYEEVGRTAGVTWDGKDENGRVVPYGIYVMRFEAVDQEYQRAERFNEAVVVIK